MSDIDSESASVAHEEIRTFGKTAKGFTQFKKGDILLAKITPCFENGKIAQATISEPLGAGSTEFHVIRAHKDFTDPRFLLHILRHPKIIFDGERKMTGSSGHRRIPESYVSSINIPDYPIEIQRRIGKTLDNIDYLRKIRRRSIELLDELTQSIFLDMFGEPGADWTSLTVQEISEPTKGSIRTGPFGSQLLHDEFVDEGIRVLGIDNAVDNEFKWGKPRFITEEKYQQLSRYTVRPGDLLITIMGTCGRCAIVPEDIPTAINTKHLCCITLDRQKCLPEFLHSYFLMHPNAQSYLHQKAKGAIMSGLNMGIIKRLPIFLPPLELQQQYVDKVERVREQKKQYQAHLAHLDELFASVQQRAFNGTLWNDPAVAL